jgi:hypothetical protein
MRSRRWIGLSIAAVAIVLWFALAVWTLRLDTDRSDAPVAGILTNAVVFMTIFNCAGGLAGRCIRRRVASSSDRDWKLCAFYVVCGTTFGMILFACFWYWLY